MKSAWKSAMTEQVYLMYENGTIIQDHIDLTEKP